MIRLIAFFIFVFAYPQIRPLPDRDYPSNPYPPIPPEQIEVEYLLGGDEPGRFREKTSLFYPPADLRRVQILKITGMENTLEIRRVRIIYTDGAEESEGANLIGDLTPESFKQVLLTGEALYRVEITTASKYFWQSPGSFVVGIVSRR